MDHANNVARLLASLARLNAVVVDDASIDFGSLQSVADHAGIMVVRHEQNLGPAAARNTGLRHTVSPVVAFIDSDCIASPEWPASLLHHFLDPSVAAVAPRVMPTEDGGTFLERYERTRSSLDMGDRPDLVRAGSRLGFVPSAALLARRSALGENAFDERLRLGEDVDLIWRLTEAGWLVRYDPAIVVQHQTRARPGDWLRRRYQYGTSAPDLEARHPGRLAPARPSAWNVAVIVLVATGHPVLGVAVISAAGALLWRQLRPLPQSPALATRTVGQGLLADAAAIGQMLRREWWPVGVVALAVSPRSKPARLAAACMLVPIALEWVKGPPPLDPIRYAFLRLVDDAAYGTGVIASSLAKRELRPLIPRPRVPGLRRY
jgi:mycofactocin system glycosyltransferase